MSFRKIPLAFMALAVFLCSCGKDNIDKSSVQDTAEIKADTEAYAEAFNQKNADKFGSMWAENASFQNPITGEKLEGRNEIAGYFKERFKKYPDRKLKLSIDNISIDEPGKASVKAHFQLTDRDGSIIEGSMLLNNVKENGKWYILNFAEFEKLPTSSQFEKLEKLNWLVGYWVDVGDNVEVKSVWKWDSHKNFLTEKFNMSVLGQDEFEGFQMLGWDSLQNKIHSWVFDSDGGFGEGTLIQEGSSWYASMAYTLPDGRTGSATNIYTKQDENSYTFSSVGREIDGNLLPNIGPYKIVRKN